MKSILPLMTVGAVLESKRERYKRKADRQQNKVFWISPAPKHCDLCHQKLKGNFIDGRTVYGPWGILCIPCHGQYGVGLGLGKGQKYNLETLEKIEG